MFRKKYGIFRIEDGVLQATVENSFSMGWSSEYVRLWDRPPKHFYDPRNPSEFMLRVNRPNLPLGIRVHFDKQRSRHRAFTWDPDLVFKRIKRVNGPDKAAIWLLGKT